MSQTISQPENRPEVDAASELEDDTANESGGTLLHLAALAGQEGLIKVLLDMGVDPFKKDEDGCTALHLAVKCGHEAAIKLLVESMGDISSKDNCGCTVMFLAVSNGYTTVVELLLEKDSSISVDVGHGFTALQLAALIGQEEVARVLLQHGVSVAAEDRFGWTALHRTADRGHVAVARLLLENGADIESRTEELSTALHIAAECDMKDMVLFLLGRGANLEAEDKQGFTVLHRCADRGHEKTGLLLLEQGANIHARDDYGGTPLHRAAGRGCEAMVQVFLEEGADINARDKQGWNPIHVAVKKGSEAVVKLLLEEGADVNAHDNSGETALHGAAIGGNEAILQVLLENDADPYAEDEDGLYPIHHARGSGYDLAVKILEEAVETPLEYASKPSSDYTKAGRSTLDQDLAELDIRLHQLCDLCSKINFPTLHDKEQCESVGCRYHITSYSSDGRPFSKVRLEVHSLGFEHHTDLDALCASAEKGCHLCSLMAFSIRNSYELLTVEGRSKFSYTIERKHYGPAQSDRVVLVFHKSSKYYPKEEIEVFCGELFTVLPVTNVPPKRCSEQGFTETGWDITTGVARPVDNSNITAQLEVRFYARCVRPNHPTRGYKEWREIDGTPLGGFPKIESYTPGQLIAVFAVRGKFWLAEFVYGIAAAYYHGGHETLGWVDGADYLKLTRAPHPSCDCGKGVWEPPLLCMIDGGQTAYLAADPLSHEALSQVDHWISLCVAEHAVCRPTDSVCLPLRVIDVGEPGIGEKYPDPFLSEGTNRTGQYATLSYRWGKGMTLTTTASTIAARRVKITLDSMPRTFQDAVTVARRLRLRYLWIDALCIMQDSAQDWQEQSAIMGQIYENAWLNLSVSGAVDFQKGFLNKRNILEIRSCRHPSLLSDSTPSGGGVSKIAKVICPNVPRHDRLPDRDPLASRGWILQEHILSKRTLHFGIHETYWECLFHSTSEREPERFEKRSDVSGFDEHGQERRFTWIAVRSGVQYLLNQSAEDLLDVLGPEPTKDPCHDEPYDHWLLRNLSKSPKERKVDLYRCSHYHPQPVFPNPSYTVGQFIAAHHLWYLLIEEYTLRFLTKPEDKLPAVSGLAGVFQKLFGTRSKYVAGLWSGDILNGLMWHSSGYGVPESKAEKRKLEPAGRSSNYRAPSFSWASIDRPVRFSVVQRNRLTGDDRYSAEVLEIESIPAGLSSLGEVSGGKLKLRAWGIPFYRILEESGDHLNNSPFDEETSFDPSDKQILCASIRNISLGYSGERPYIHRQCLLLYPLGSDEFYRRVGCWTVQIPEPPRPLLIAGVDFTDRLKFLERKPEKTIDYTKPAYEGWRKMEVTIV